MRYIGRRGSVAKAVLINAVPPLMLKTANNPGGLPLSAFDQIRAGVLAGRTQFFQSGITANESRDHVVVLAPHWIQTWLSRARP